MFGICKPLDRVPLFLFSDLRIREAVPGRTTESGGGRFPRLLCTGQGDGRGGCISRKYGFRGKCSPFQRDF